MNPDVSRWAGKVALVTGASSGIGRAIATDLGAIGMKLSIAGRSVEGLEETAKAVRLAGGDALCVAGDQCDPAVNTRLFERTREKWGPVDLLVNGAGALGGHSLLESDLREIQAALDLNIRAALLCMREAAAEMRGKAEAAIINISSMSGHRVVPGTPALYAATKHALRLLTDGIRNELAARGDNVKVALISPGLVDTPWHSRPGGRIAEKGSYPYPPLQAADVAAAVRYILSAPPGVQVCDILLRPSAQTF